MRGQGFVNLAAPGTGYAVRRPGTALRREGAVVGGVMVAYEQDGEGVVYAGGIGFRIGRNLVNKGQGGLDGFFGMVAGQGPVDKVVDHVHDNERGIFHHILKSAISWFRRFRMPVFRSYKSSEISTL